jgi:hypothetical protein
VTVRSALEALEALTDSRRADFGYVLSGGVGRRISGDG